MLRTAGLGLGAESSSVAASPGSGTTPSTQSSVVASATRQPFALLGFHAAFENTGLIVQRLGHCGVPGVAVRRGTRNRYEVHTSAISSSPWTQLLVQPVPYGSDTLSNSSCDRIFV